MSTSALNYLKIVKIAQDDAKYFLAKIAETIAWKDDCAVLDVGCGPGNVTNDILLPILPKSAIVVAIDKSEEMIRYAKEHYGKSSRTVFIHMDIVFPIPSFTQTFDHIISLYCLHFVGEQKTALQNIFKMLNHGGSFFFTCVVQCEIFQVIASISCIETWSPYIYDYQKHMSPYQHSQTPKEDLEKLLLEVGYDVSFITSEPREFYYPIGAIKDLFLIFPFITVPKHLEAEFQLDIEKTIQKMGFNRTRDGEKFYYTSFQVLFGQATKTNGCGR